MHRIAPTSAFVEGPGASLPGASGSAGLRRLLDVVEARGGRLRVMIDLRCCAYPMSGTQVQALQLVRALSSVDQADVAVLLPDGDPSLGFAGGFRLALERSAPHQGEPAKPATTRLSLPVPARRSADRRGGDARRPARDHTSGHDHEPYTRATFITGATGGATRKWLRHRF